MTTTRRAAIDVSRLFAIGEFQTLAEERMPEAVRINVQCEGTGRALRANVAAWDRWALRPKVLVDVSSCDTSTTVLGEPIELPALIAPFTCSALCHPDGELGVARASARAATIMTLSMGSTRSPEEIAVEVPRFWMHLGATPDRGLMAEVVRRASNAGACALCLTVDLPVFPWWPRVMVDALRALELDPFIVGETRTLWDESVRAKRSADDATFKQLRDSSLSSFTWADLEWLRELSSLPLVLKGVQTGEDARRAIEHGAAAVVVSNHGGHALDQARATAQVLPEVVAAVDGRLEVLVDGGIRSGADVLRALALGARAVLIGRPALWGLTVGGADGVARVLELLHEELEVLMAMCGARRISEIDSTMVALNS
jgi:4-hydroxymandelate oxidase